VSGVIFIYSTVQYITVQYSKHSNNEISLHHIMAYHIENQLVLRRYHSIEWNAPTLHCTALSIRSDPIQVFYPTRKRNSCSSLLFINEMHDHVIDDNACLNSSTIAATLRCSSALSVARNSPLDSVTMHSIRCNVGGSASSLP
jgi:hypothetical protein